MTLKNRVTNLEGKTGGNVIHVVVMGEDGKPVPGQRLPDSGILVRISQDDAKL